MWWLAFSLRSCIKRETERDWGKTLASGPDSRSLAQAKDKWVLEVWQRVPFTSTFLSYPLSSSQRRSTTWAKLPYSSAQCLYQLKCRMFNWRWCSVRAKWRESGWADHSAPKRGITFTQTRLWLQSVTLHHFKQCCVFLFLNLTFYMGFSLFNGCVPLGKSRGRGWDVTGQALLTCIFHINTTGQHIKRTSYTMA